ncbi:HAD-IIIA family hydrolase [Leptospira noguchii]|uniref:KdsC family phosphatase n=1 Tax=Leptospira noguchii TaxID=28182 RepID=UPI0002C00F84|nr:HAD-IIIA family hydrolase [Leptospira noguchii]EMI64660.1 putative 3-deoxy-manno-octulosonate-8-phosphatase [Leptospira noguchii str. Bonito]UOG36666.1 HAD-IIIA family hydrolase [Leptospira noguchii]
MTFRFAFNFFFKEKLKNVELLIIDVDGVLTDGKLYYTEDGEVQKVFDVKDGLGIKLANKEIILAIMSGNSSAIIKRRAQDLGIKYCFVGIVDKAECLRNLMKELNLAKEKVAYIGDDLNDLVVRPLVNCFVCPSDAHRIIIQQSDIVLSSKGGNGAVREFTDRVLIAKGILNDYSIKGVTEGNV